MFYDKLVLQHITVTEMTYDTAHVTKIKKNVKPLIG